MQPRQVRDRRSAAGCAGRVRGGARRADAGADARYPRTSSPPERQRRHLRRRRTGLCRGPARLRHDRLYRATGAASAGAASAAARFRRSFAGHGCGACGLAARRRVGLDRPAIEAEAQRLQHAAKLVRRAAEQRHHLRNDGEAAVAGRALRRRRSRWCRATPSSGRMRSASRSSMSRRTARGPHT